jgi:hypothetical protein
MTLVAETLFSSRRCFSAVKQKFESQRPQAGRGTRSSWGRRQLVEALNKR